MLIVGKVENPQDTAPGLKWNCQDAAEQAILERKPDTLWLPPAAIAAWACPISSAFICSRIARLRAWYKAFRRKHPHRKPVAYRGRRRWTELPGEFGGN